MFSTFGALFRVTTFGESHCKGVGAVVDGCPPNLALAGRCAVQSAVRAHLPDDLIVLELGYDADHPCDDHCRKYAAAGVPFYVCPGTSTWNTVTGRTSNAVANLRSAAGNDADACCRHAGCGCTE